MSDTNLTPAQLQALLQFASKRLGTTPEKLLETYQKGGLSGVSDTFGKGDSTPLNALTGDTSQLEQLLQTPQTQQMIQQLLNNLGKSK